MCHNCKKYFINNEMHYYSGNNRYLCSNCASIRKVKKIGDIYIPKFLLRANDLEWGSVVKLVQTKKGILIRKYNPKKDGCRIP